MARKSKLQLWFKYYTDETNKDTFLNKTASAKAAKYKGKDDNSFGCIGYQNYGKLQSKINIWLEEVGLSENTLKLKLKSLMEASETKFMKVKGYIGTEDLPEGSKSMGTTGFVHTDKDGNESYSAGDTLVAIQMAAIEVQRKTLDMALKVKGLYSPEEHNIRLPDGIEVSFVKPKPKPESEE